MKNLKSNQVCLALAFVGVVSAVSAQNMPNKMGHQMGGHYDKGGAMNCVQGLNLTDEQRLKMIELRKRFFEGNQERKTARRTAMQNLIDADQFDEAAARKLIDERDAERKQNQINHLKFSNEMNKILTPEQRKLQSAYQKGSYKGMQGYMKRDYKNRGHRMNGHNQGNRHMNNRHMNGGHMGMMGQQGSMHQGVMSQDN